MLRSYCGFTESDFLDCEIDKGVYFVVQHHNDVMDERAFQYAVHGGKPKDDPYFRDLFKPPEMDMSNEQLSDEELSQLKRAHEFLRDKYGGQR